QIADRRCVGCMCSLGVDKFVNAKTRYRFCRGIKPVQVAAFIGGRNGIVLIEALGSATNPSRSTWKCSAIRNAVDRSNNSLEYSNRPPTPPGPFHSERLTSNLDDLPGNGEGAQEKRGAKSFV